MKTTLKKLTAFILAMGLMTASMTTVYASGYSYTDASEEFTQYIESKGPYATITEDLSKGGIKYVGNYFGTIYFGTEPPASANEHEWFHYYIYNSSAGYDYNGDYYWNGSKWMREGDAFSWDERNAAVTGASDENSDYVTDNEALLAELARQAAAKEAGFASVAAMNYAAIKNMSAAEYYNNMIINTPGIEEATPVGQGGKLIINGKESGITATFDKVARSYVDSVRTQAEGTVLNVVKIGLPLADGMGVITTNFYMPGVAAGDEITVLQYVNGAWVELAVTEIRADHVVLNLERSGVIAFVQK